MNTLTLDSLTIVPIWQSSVASLVITVFCYYRNMLTVSGMIASTVLGIVTYSAGGPQSFVPLVAFFLAVNLAGKVGDKILHQRSLKTGEKKLERLEEKGSRRDALQVFSNTGPAFLCVILFSITRSMDVVPEVYSTAFFYAFLGSIIASGSDTFSSELGILSKKKPISIITFKPVTKGLSGGISLWGYFVGMIGSVIPFSFAVPFLDIDRSHIIMGLCLSVIIGFLGSTVDSLLGALIQEKTKCDRCGLVSEKWFHCGKHTTLFNGFKGITNDHVNLASTISGAILGFIWGVWFQ